jgi:hypothetical protein
VSLEHRVGNKRSRNASSAEKATIKTLDSLLGVFNRIKLDVYLALRAEYD